MDSTDDRTDGFGRLLGLGVALALLVVTLGAGATWLVVGAACSDGIDEKSAQFIVCEVEFAETGTHDALQAAAKSKSAAHIAGTLLLALPSVILLAGLAVSLVQRRRRAVVVSLLLAPIPLVLTWLALFFLGL